MKILPLFLLLPNGIKLRLTRGLATPHLLIFGDPGLCEKKN
jgi:hypothetical protein